MATVSEHQVIKSLTKQQVPHCEGVIWRTELERETRSSWWGDSV